MKKPLLILILILVFTFVGAAELKPIVLDPSYNHDKYQTLPKDIIREFRAYTVSFDSDDDDNGDKHLQCKGFLECTNGLVDQLGAVVKRHDTHL